ncbi:hypothetical protein L6452_35401 [Arctium lappa]|uniref:Uncharacterized protein n=1 Tax=Arctium lappa TaxID=4217 RepID=A0ACB8Y6B3_ARCLA|nr:hypothetical protein L6452_35401 [Arctium lappa]
MAIGAAGDGMFQRLYGGCISTDEMVVRRRPYHSNCNCALHKYSGGGHCSPVGKVSYPMRRSWSEGSMAAMNSSMVELSNMTFCIDSSTWFPSSPAPESNRPTLYDLVGLADRTALKLDLGLKQQLGWRSTTTTLAAMHALLK